MLNTLPYLTADDRGTMLPIFFYVFKPAKPALLLARCRQFVSLCVGVTVQKRPNRSRCRLGDMGRRLVHVGCPRSHALEDGDTHGRHLANTIERSVLGGDEDCRSNYCKNLPLFSNRKHLKNVGPIRHCEPPHAACSNFTLPFTRRCYCRHHYQDEPKPAIAIAQAACDSSDTW